MRCLVVDDEPLGRERLESLLHGEPDCQHVVCCDSVPRALEHLREQRFDLLLLDVEMPEQDGFALVAQLPALGRPHVVFVTAHESHAVRAFGVRALDYLLKPFDRLRFGETLARVRAQSHPPSHPPSASARIAVRSGDQSTLFLEIADIDWIGAAGNYVEIHVGPRSHLVRQTLSEIAAQLAPDRFERVHRGAIVSVSSVCELRGGGRDPQVVLRSGVTLSVGKSYRDAVEARLRRSR